MNSTLRIILLGAATWAIPFAAGMLLYPLHESDPPLFETLLALSVCLAGCLMGWLLIKKQPDQVRTSGFLIGIYWFLICIALDIPIFVMGFGMDLPTYTVEIGLTYLMLPVILWTLSRVLRHTTADA